MWYGALMQRTTPQIVHRDTSLRSVVKAISWRLLGTLGTMAVVWYFTRRVDVAATVGGIEAAGKVFLFYLHERVWDRVHLGRRRLRPAVLWLTGLSGAGKSTLAEHLERRLKAEGLPCEVLDGDTIRSIFPTTGFSREEREAHVKRVGHLASRLEAHGVFVIVSLISPFEASRRFARGLCKNFVEIYLSTPLAECERRDVKGLYARARRGDIKGFTGIDDPYEAPQSPELNIDTTQIDVQQAGDQVMERLLR